MSLYDDIDPFMVCMSALALGLISGLDEESFWIACNIADNPASFDTAILAACRLKELVEEH